MLGKKNNKIFIEKKKKLKNNGIVIRLTQNYYIVSILY